MMEKSLNPEPALLLKPGFELDVFIYRYIFDGIPDVVESPSGKALERPIPSFSRRADAAKALLIKMVMENQDLPITIRFGDDLFRVAKLADQVSGDKNFPVWSVAMGSNTGYGRSLEEGICKLAIVTKMREDAA